MTMLLSNCWCCGGAYRLSAYRLEDDDAQFCSLCQQIGLEYINDENDDEFQEILSGLTHLELEEA